MSLLPSITADVVPGTMMDTSYKLIELMPNTTYDILVASRFGTCVGIPNTISVPTLTVEAGLPQGKLTVVNMYLRTPSLKLCLLVGDLHIPTSSRLYFYETL